MRLVFQSLHDWRKYGAHSKRNSNVDTFRMLLRKSRLFYLESLVQCKMQVHAFAVLSRTFGPSPSHTAKGILLHNILYIVLSFPLALMQHNDLFESEELAKVHQIQTWSNDYIRLLNKPYENKVTLTWHNPPLKCC